MFNDSTLWITGGEDGANYLKSTEFVFVNQPPIEGPVYILGQKDLSLNTPCRVDCLRSINQFKPVQQSRQQAPKSLLS